MTRRERPSLDRLLDLSKKHLTTDNPELLTLKGHVLVEVALAHLLAERLESHETDLPGLTFAELARVALAGLAGPTADRLRNATVLLNNLRNDLAHELEAATLDDRMRDIASIGYSALGMQFNWRVSEAERVNRYMLGVAWIVGNLEGVTRWIRQQRVSTYEPPEQTSTSPGPRPYRPARSCSARIAT